MFRELKDFSTRIKVVDRYKGGTTLNWYQLKYFLFLWFSSIEKVKRKWGKTGKESRQRPALDRYGLVFEQKNPNEKDGYSCRAF